MEWEAEEQIQTEGWDAPSVQMPDPRLPFWGAWGNGQSMVLAPNGVVPPTTPVLGQGAPAVVQLNQFVSIVQARPKDRVAVVVRFAVQSSPSPSAETPLFPSVVIRIAERRNNTVFTRIVAVPPWGIAFGVNACDLDVSAAFLIGSPGDTLRVEAGVSYGPPLREWLPDPGPDGNFGVGPTGYDYVIPPGGHVDVQPLPFSRRMMVTVRLGTLTDPNIPAGDAASLILAAMPRSLVAGGGGATISVMWEIVGA